MYYRTCNSELLFSLFQKILIKMIRADKLMRIITGTNKIFMTMATQIKDVTVIQTEKKAKEMGIHREKTSKEMFL